MKTNETKLAELRKLVESLVSASREVGRQGEKIVTRGTHNDDNEIAEDAEDAAAASLDSAIMAMLEV